MSRNAKIAGVAALTGIMLAVAAVDALREPGDMPLDAVLPLLDEGEAQTLLARELERCAALTMPDSGCEQAWAANRRRFFGKDAAAPEAEIGNGSDGPAIPADPAGSSAP